MDGRGHASGRPSCPPAGSRGRLRVLFGNFSVEADCEVVGLRRASSRLPDGFGVRFTNLNAEAGDRLDRIVRDALLRLLLEPSGEAGLPSLAEDELLPAGFRRL